MDLADPLAPAGDVQEAILVQEPEIPGGEDTLQVVSEREVLPRLGVAHHHIGARVHDRPLLARASAPAIAHVDGETAAGDGDAHGSGLVGKTIPGHARDPGRGLRLAVHDVQAATAASHLGVEAEHALLGSQAPARLGERAQRRSLDVLEADAEEKVVGVRDAGHRGAALGPKHLPEAWGDHRLVGEDDARPGQEVAVQDRQAVRVIGGGSPSRARRRRSRAIPRLTGRWPRGSAVPAVPASGCRCSRTWRAGPRVPDEPGGVGHRRRSTRARGHSRPRRDSRPPPGDVSSTVRITSGS